MWQTETHWNIFHHTTQDIQVQIAGWRVARAWTQSGADREEQDPVMPHDYPTQHVTDANAGAYPTMHSTNMITDSSAASSSHVNISYQAVLQALQGRRHEPLDRALEPPE